MTAKDDEQDARIDNLERRVAVLEGETPTPTPPPARVQSPKGFEHTIGTAPIIDADLRAWTISLDGKVLLDGEPATFPDHTADVVLLRYSEPPLVDQANAAGDWYRWSGLPDWTAIPDPRPPAPSPGPAPSPVGPVNVAIADMALPNDLMLPGVNQSAAWAKRAAVTMGADLRGAHTPTWWNPADASLKSAKEWEASEGWCVIFDGEGNGAVATRVHLGWFQLWIQRRSTGRWQQIGVTQVAIGGALYPKSLQGSPGAKPIMRIEPDGAISVLPPLDRSLVFHGFCLGRQAIVAPSDIRCAFVTMRARLIAGSAADVAKAKYLLSPGLDWYPTMESTIEDFAPTGFNPGCGSGRAKLITTEWQDFSFTTMNVGAVVPDPGGGTITEQEFRRDPPHPLTGGAPVPPPSPGPGPTPVPPPTPGYKPATPPTGRGGAFVVLKPTDPRVVVPTDFGAYTSDETATGQAPAVSPKVQRTHDSSVEKLDDFVTMWATRVNGAGAFKPWTDLDGYVDHWQRRGVLLDWVLFGTPTIYSTNPGQVSVYGPNWPSGLAWAPRPEHRDKFGRFVATLVDRYGKAIRRFEHWNEPNFGWSDNWSPSSSTWNDSGEYGASFWCSTALELAELAKVGKQAAGNIPFFGPGFVDQLDGYQAGQPPDGRQTKSSMLLYYSARLADGTYPHDWHDGACIHSYQYDASANPREKLVMPPYNLMRAGALEACGMGGKPGANTEIGAESGAKGMSVARKAFMIRAAAIVNAAAGMGEACFYKWSRPEQLGDPAKNPETRNALVFACELGGQVLRQCVSYGDGSIWAETEAGVAIDLRVP